MKKEVDMYYRFTSEEEPSEEQLQTLMEEVIEDVRKENSNIQKIISENIRKECENINKIFPQL